MNICLAPSRVLCSPNLGGHAWVYANWSLGLQANGCNIFWLERFNPGTPPNKALALLRHLIANLREIKLDVPICLVYWPGQKEEYSPIKREIEELTAPLEAVAAQADLLLNFYYALEPEILRLFTRTALVDIDPGLLQTWIAGGQLKVRQHDLYFTIGETVGTAKARFSDCGIRWNYVPPVVYLPAWPIEESNSESPYSTISTWWTRCWEKLDGETYNNEKRNSFLEYLDLPSRIQVPLALALFLADSDLEEQDRKTLLEAGWQLDDPRAECETPAKYRSYIRHSRGEFSCVKPSCIRLQNAWISDRTLCYLASGKPAIVQHTGPSEFLPDAGGLFRFSNLSEAMRAFETIERDYGRQSRRARELAEEYFDAKKVTAGVLNKVELSE